MVTPVTVNLDKRDIFPDDKIVIIGTTEDDILNGTLWSDDISGLEGNDTLNGKTGNDCLFGNDGSDLLEGGRGADTLDGGNDTDTASYLSSSAAVTISLALGTTSGGDAEGDVITNVENLIGSTHNDILAGDDNSNRIEGNEGNDTIITGSGDDDLLGGTGDDLLQAGVDEDTLEGGAGADTLEGGAGHDVAFYMTSSAAVNVSLSTGTGTGGDAEGDVLTSIEEIIGSIFDDTLEGDSSGNVLNGSTGNDAASYASSSAAVNVSLHSGGSASGGDAEGDTLINIQHLIGSAFNDTLNGTDNSNSIEGGAGNDLIIGENGRDTLSGGAGSDALLGQNDPDLMFGGDGSDLLDGGNNNDTLYGGADDDDLRGWNQNDLLFGEDGNDTLDGGGGNDTLEGGADADTINGNSGTDLASYASSSAAVEVNLATNTGIGGDAAGDIFQNIENLLGSAFDDTLTGNSSNNEISGDNGNDTLTSVGGVDTLLGGAGNDSLTSQLGTTMLDGGSGEDTLEALAGGDVTLTGGLDKDEFVFSTTAGDDHVITDYNQLEGDIITPSGSFDSARIQATLAGDTVVTLFSGANTVGMTLSAVAATSVSDVSFDPGFTDPIVWHIVGTSNNDTLTSNNDPFVLIQGLLGNDAINGGSGNDTLEGGAGDDTLTGNASDDVFAYTQIASGNDTITDFENPGAAVGDLIQFDSSVFATAAAAFAATANVGGDAVITLDGSNSITITGVGATFTVDDIVIV